MRMRWGAGLAAGVAAAALAGAGAAATATAARAAGTTTTASARTAGASALEPPPVTVLTDKGGSRDGDIFVSPFGGTSSYANGAEILSPDGKKVVWFHPAPAGEEDADFRVQTYEGKKVLTFWQGTGLGGVTTGADYIYDSRYRLIATVQAGNGYQADGHEFAITPQGTALVLAYATKTANLTSIGGPADQKVIDGIVQEIDIKTGRVLLQWDAAAHVPYSQSEQLLPSSASSAWDWFHINAVKVDTDGNLLVDARNTWTVYKVSRHTGKVLWQLGGKASSFAITTAHGQTLNDAGEFFAWQHDPEPLGHNVYSVFDNEAGGIANTGTGVSSELAYSRAVRVRLDLGRHVATLVSSADQPGGALASSQGNAQTVHDGDLVVGWGSLPYFSTFSASGTLLFNAEFPSGVNSYRAYRFDWPAAVAH